MKREKLEELVRWKGKSNRKPLVLRGARQVGKTWLLKEFGRTQYENVVYVNFENTPTAASLFEKDLDPKRIISQLEILNEQKITPEKTLVIFDEVQEVPRALTSLKYFCEDAPLYHVAVAGSLLGMGIHNGLSFPVGKVDFIDMHPMTFVEFLAAIGKEMLAAAVKELQWDALGLLHETLKDALRLYLFTGGMPEVVQTFIDRRDFDEVREVQNRILISYQSDFSKHTPKELFPRLNMVWNSLPAQLSKENKKFIYGVMREGARAKDYELAIIWLEECGLLHKCMRVSKPAMPLAAYTEQSVFKLYLVDVGLLSAMTGLEARILADGDSIFTEFKGALTEQYVMQQLVGNGENKAITYWTNDRSTAEVDFIVQHDASVFPIEVKAEQNLRAKSFKYFCDRYSPTKAFKCSLMPFKDEGWMQNFPLYAVGML